MVSEVSAVKHETNEKRDEVFFVGVSVFGEEVHEKLFFLITLNEFGEHLIGSGLGFFLEVFVTDRLKLLIKSHSPSCILDNFVAFRI